MRTLYDDLGVPRQADAGAIKKAWRRVARECHPDLNRDASSEVAAELKARFEAASEAYAVLGDAASRSTYDQALDQAERLRAPRVCSVCQIRAPAENADRCLLCAMTAPTTPSEGAFRGRPGPPRAGSREQELEQQYAWVHDEGTFADRAARGAREHHVSGFAGLGPDDLLAACLGEGAVRTALRSAEGAEVHVDMRFVPTHRQSILARELRRTLGMARRVAQPIADWLRDG